MCPLIFYVMDPILGAALIGAGVHALGSGVDAYSTIKTNEVNQKINRENIAAAKEMQERNFQYQTDMWEKTNDYNSPVNQRRLYQLAGVNPYAVMQDGGFSPASAMSGGNGSVPSSIPMQSYHPNFSGVADAFNDFFKNKYSREQTEALSLDNDFKRQTLQTRISEQIESLEQKKVLTQQDKTRLDMLYEDLDFLRKTQKYRISQARSDADASQLAADNAAFEGFWNQITSSTRFRQLELSNQLTERDIVRLRKEVSKIDAEIDSLEASGELTHEQAAEVRQRVTINAPDEERSKMQTELYHGKYTGKVEHFIDRFSSYLDRFVPKIVIK